MKSLTDLYEEIERLKLNNLTCDVTYIVSNMGANQKPPTTIEIISIKFPASIEESKIVRVCDYIERTYGHYGGPVQKASLTASHTLRLEVVKPLSTLSKRKIFL